MCDARWWISVHRRSCSTWCGSLSAQELGGVPLEHRAKLVWGNAVQCFDQLESLGRCCNDQLARTACTGISETMGQAGGCEYACSRRRRDPLIADAVLDLPFQYIERFV